MKNLTNDEYISEDIPKTERAQEWDNTAKDLTVDIFTGRSNITPMNILDQIAVTPKMSIQNAVLFTVSMRIEHPNMGPDIPVTEEYALNHYGRSVLKNNAGAFVLLADTDRHSDVCRYKETVCYGLSQTKGEPVPRTLPYIGDSALSMSKSNRYHMDVIKSSLIVSRNGDPISTLISDYVFTKHFFETMDSESQKEFTSTYSPITVNSLLTDYFRDGNWEDISYILQGAFKNASEGIDNLTNALEADVELDGRFHDATLFGSYVLCSSDKDIRAGEMTVPIDMYAYELYTKDGKDYIAKQTPEDGEFRMCILTGNAITGTDGPGLCTGNEFHRLNDYRCDIKDFRFENEDSPFKDMGFYHKDCIVKYNPQLVLREPSKLLRVYGVFNNGEITDGGYLHANEVPHSVDAYFDFKNKHNISADSDTVILNCGGKLSGLTTEKQIQQNEGSRITTYKDSIMTKEQVRAFVSEHGGDINWSVEGYAKDAKTDIASDNMPKRATNVREPLEKKIRENKEKNLLTHSTSGANLSASQELF